MTNSNIELIRQYRQEMQNLQENKDILSNPDNDEILNIIERSGQLFQSVEGLREAAMDAECFTLQSDITLEKSQRLKTGFRMYEIPTFISKFRELYAEDDTVTHSQLVQFGTELLKHTWRTAPVNPLTQGIVVDKVRKERRRIQKSDVGEAVKPKQVTADDWAAAKETPERIKSIKNILKSVGEKPFFEFVLDPSSFGQTVENIFYSSFLVKEGSACLTVKDKVPYIRLTAAQNAEKKGRRADEKVGQNQTVCTIEYSQWKELVDAIGEDFTQMIPHRDVCEEALKAMEQYNTSQFYEASVSQRRPSEDLPKKRVNKKSGKMGKRD